MKEENPLSIYAINAKVILDFTKEGKEKYTIRLNNNSGDAVDLIQQCHDYDKRIPASFRLIEGSRVFKNDNSYVTFAMYPNLKANSNYLLTSSCNYEGLSQKRALELIQEGMNQAYDKMYEWNNC